MSGPVVSRGLDSALDDPAYALTMDPQLAWIFGRRYMMGNLGPDSIISTDIVPGEPFLMSQPCAASDLLLVAPPIKIASDSLNRVLRP